MAAVIFNSLAAEKGLDYVAESAGAAAVGDRPASHNAVLAAAEPVLVVFSVSAKHKRSCSTRIRKTK